MGCSTRRSSIRTVLTSPLRMASQWLLGLILQWPRRGYGFAESVVCCFPSRMTVPLPDWSFSQRRTFSSLLSVTTHRLSALIATRDNSSSWPPSTTIESAGSSALRSHTRAVLSTPPVTSQRLSGLIARHDTPPRCPGSTMTDWSGSLARRSLNCAGAPLRIPPVASQRLSALIAMIAG